MNINRRIHLRNLFKMLLLLVTGLIVASILRSIIIYFEGKNSYCRSNDEIYQTIHANLNTWIKNYFRPNQTSSNNYLYFSTSNGEKYTAIGMEPDRFFVITEYDYPASYLGLKGYIYAPGGMQNYTEYHFTPLGENIFCYEASL